MINTLLENYEKIKSKDYETDIYMYIVQSSSKIIDKLIIKDFFCLFPIKHIKSENLKEKKFKENVFTVTKKIPIEEFISKVKFLQQYEINQEVNYYILIAKVVNIFDEKIKTQTIGIDPFTIVSDFLHILSLYFAKYFITIPKDYIILSKESYQNEFRQIIENEDSNIKNTLEIQKNIEHNLNVICDLRMEQFLFLFKGLSNFNYSLLISENNISVAFSLLITVIETFATKYSNAKEKWDEYTDNSFYIGLKKLLQDSSLDENLFNDLFEQIGKLYIQNTHQSLAKFKDFVLKFIGVGFISLEDPKNIQFKKDLAAYYNLRSKYLHAGKEFPTKDKKTDMVYNLTKSNRKSKKKLKTYGDQHHLDLKKLLPYNWFIDMAKSCIITFIDYLYIRRADDEDKTLYSEIDKQPRGQILVTISKPVKPMDQIYNGDFYIKNQYADLYKHTKTIKKLEVGENYKALVEKYNNILKILENSNDSLKLGITYNLLGVALSYIGDIDNAIKNAKKSLIIIEPLDYKFLIAEINYNLACFYCLKGSKQEAVNYFQNAIRDNSELSKFFKESAKNDSQLEGCLKDLHI